MAFASHTFLNAVTATGNGTELAMGDTVNRITVGVSGTFVGTITFEASVDGGTTYAAVPMIALSAGSLPTTTTTTTGFFRLPDRACLYSHIRCRVSAYTSGSITAKGRYE